MTPDSRLRGSASNAADSSPIEPKHAVATLHDNWSLERLLGSGSQGQVWHARHKRDTKATCAMKLLRNCTDARNEVAAYNRLAEFAPHPHLLHAAFLVADRISINIGFELCQTDMLEYVLSRGKLPEVEAQHWVRQITGAVGHLHACGVVHLDIKLENIFVDASNQLKLGDLGLAAVVSGSGYLSKMCGSGVYAAPEVLLSRDYGPYDGRAADVWSVGVCAFVMARGRFPFHVKHQTKGFTAYLEMLARAHVQAGSVAIVHFHHRPKPWVCNQSLSLARGCGWGNGGGAPTHVQHLHGLWRDADSKCKLSTGSS